VIALSVRPSALAIILTFLTVAGTFAADPQAPPVTESIADQRLTEIFIAQQELIEASEEGVGEEGLLVRAQDIARSYETFLADNPDHFYGWVLCGRFLRSIGADTDALAALRKADDLRPNTAVVQRLIGQVLADQEIYEAALPFLLRAVDLDPDEPTYHDDLGVFLLQFGSTLEKDGVLQPGRAPELALRSFQKAFRLDSENFERAWRWAEAHSELPDPDWEATALAWQQVIPLADSPVEREATRLRLARAWLEAADPKRALSLMDPVETSALQESWDQLHRQIEEKLQLSGERKLLGQGNE